MIVTGYSNASIIYQSDSLKELRLYRSGTQDFEVLASSPCSAIFMRKRQVDEGEVWAYKVKPKKEVRWLYAIQWTGNKRSVRAYVREKKGFVGILLGRMPAEAKRKYQNFVKKEK